MPRGFLRYLVRRVALALVLIATVSSAALFLAVAAPGDHLSGFDIDPAVAAAERARLGLDRPFIQQYADWAWRALRLDLGESLIYRRPVTALVAGRAVNTALLGAAALILATAIGIPAGVVTGSRRTAAAAALRGLSLLIVSVPSLVTSFALLLVASRTGWLPVGGYPADSSATLLDVSRYLLLPALALALPIAATLERLQSRSLAEAMAAPSIAAATARGCGRPRIVWKHAFRQSLTPVLAVYGVVIGSVLSGSFIVEIVTSWPGLGALMHDALIARDMYLVAGCAAAGAMFLAAGILLSDVAHVLLDPRAEGQP